MRLIPHGCEIATAAPARARFGIPEGAFAVAYSGAFVEEKRHEALLDALCGVQDQIPGMFVLFAGAPGPTLEPTRRRLEERFPGSFFCETLAAAEMPAFYASADVYAHARLRESFGNAFVQAQMQGVPVIANRTDIHLEVLGADGALFVDLEAPEALADAIRTLYLSPDWRHRLGDLGRQNVCRYSWEKVAPAFVEMFRDFAALPPVG
jgi:glycosyltransferase involved in cell wall biosynthesis